MIFDTNYTSGSSYDNMRVKPSPYPLGLEGALMHVYENECNYNAIMKAVGISELKYYQETGQELFINEAGAFGGFINKVKAFFKKVIEKIKQIFHKFMAVINQYTMSDKDFVKKYEKELYRKDLKDFEFNGYTFENLETNHTTINTNVSKTVTSYHPNFATLTATDGAYAKSDNFYSADTDRSRRYSTRAATASKIGTATMDNPASDWNGDNYGKDKDMDSLKETMRGGLIGKGSIDESELREELQEMLYGDTEKENFEVKSIREWLQYITNASKDIKDVDKSQKTFTKDIDSFIKKFEESQKDYAKISDDEIVGKSVNSKTVTAKSASDRTAAKNKVIESMNKYLDVARSISNDIVVIFGMLTQAYKDRNRQAKAICVKALSYKHESANLYNESASYTDDLFAGVVIK